MNSIINTINVIKNDTFASTSKWNGSFVLTSDNSWGENSLRT